MTIRASLAQRLSLHAILHSRGVWALGDQAVVSLGSCLTAIVLAGALPVRDFGTFVLIVGLVLFLNNLHGSLVTFPLSVLGAPADRRELRRLTGSALLFTGALFVPLTLGLMPIAAIDRRGSLIAYAAAAMLLWQIQETLRRAMMAHLRHRDAMLGDAIRYIGQIAVIWLMARSRALNLEAALLTIAAAAVPAVLVQVIQLRPVIFSAWHEWPTLMRDHWRLGRWVLVSSVIAVLGVQAVPWTLAYVHGNEEVARFGLLSQVMGATNPVIISMAGLIVPAVAAERHHGTAVASRVALTQGAQAAALLLPYCAAVLLFPELFLKLFSTNNPAYTDLGTSLRFVATAYLLFFPSQVVQALLNGLGRTRSAFSAQCAFAFATLVLSVPLAVFFGLKGAVVGGVLPSLVYLAVSASMVLTLRTRAAATAADDIVPAAAHSSPAPNRTTA